jgi:hypothetical protein
VRLIFEHVTANFTPGSCFRRPATCSFRLDHGPVVEHDVERKVLAVDLQVLHAGLDVVVGDRADELGSAAWTSFGEVMAGGGKGRNERGSAQF